MILDGRSRLSQLLSAITHREVFARLRIRGKLIRRSLDARSLSLDEVQP